MRLVGADNENLIMHCLVIVEQMCINITNGGGCMKHTPACM